MIETVKVSEKQITTQKTGRGYHNHNWKPGQSGNPYGRPRKPEVELVRQAIEATEIEQKKSLWKHLIEQCYKDNNVLVAVAKKFLPDQISVDVTQKDFDVEKHRIEMLEALNCLQ